MTYRIKNWKKFQHFKDRRPPWIKLYRDILDDLEWHNLSGDTAKALVMLWLIASEKDGILPDIKQLAFRFRTTEKKINDTLSMLSHWLICDDISTISPRYQSDAPEKRREETEERRPPAFNKPFLEDVKAYCLERGGRVDPEKWMDYYESNGWRVGRNPMKDWKAAIRTWERNGFPNKSDSKEAPHWSEIPATALKK